MVFGRSAELGGLGSLGGLLLLLLLVVGEEVVVAAEAGAGELLLVLLAHLPDLGEVHGVVRHGAVLHVPVPERRHRHPRGRPLPLHHTHAWKSSIKPLHKQIAKKKKNPWKNSGKQEDSISPHKRRKDSLGEMGIGLTSLWFSFSMDDLSLADTRIFSSCAAGAVEQIWKLSKKAS